MGLEFYFYYLLCQQLRALVKDETLRHRDEMLHGKILPTPKPEAHGRMTPAFTPIPQCRI